MNSKDINTEPSDFIKENSKVSPKGGDLEGAHSKVSPNGEDLSAGQGLDLVSVIIRRAVKEDCKRLMELVYELAAYERAPEEITTTLNHFEESGFGTNPVWWAFVAEVDGIIQGFALYYVRYSTWKGQRMYLEDILVNEQFRGKQIGRLLFDRLIEEAKEKKFTGIAWQVLDWNEPAINFYKKYGGVTIDKGWLNCSINF